jgi:hypothetical protein
MDGIQTNFKFIECMEGYMRKFFKYWAFSVGLVTILTVFFGLFISALNLLHNQSDIVQGTVGFITVTVCLAFTLILFTS